ncbi:MAG TPA: glycosyltransferase [Casimicrobiaceae bacterium]|nr:glycosyltransferase [Casimicrobiaceae bacterium]
MAPPEPRIVVLSSLFPHAAQPAVGSFIRERMFRVAKAIPLTVVAPAPWFPLQGLLRAWRPHFRPPAPPKETQQGIEIRRPRFLSVPGAAKWLDGFSMAISCLPLLASLKRRFGANIIDAHFAYPEGYAAALLGRWLRLPVCITLRGTEVPLARDPRRRRRMIEALRRATRIFAVSESLKRHAVEMGVDADKILVVGNGVDTVKFRRIEQRTARRALALGDGPVLISVGALVERKGFHRVIECLPELRRRFQGLKYLIVGGAGPEGDFGPELKRLVDEKGLGDCVAFLGAVAQDRLHMPLSAADAFVLATRNEGWANVFLEAMACGLPVVTTNVGGNAEVVSDPRLGIVVPFGDREALSRAIDAALSRPWDRDAIVAHAQAESWERRVATLDEEFAAIAARGPTAGMRAADPSANPLPRA